MTHAENLKPIFTLAGLPGDFPNPGIKPVSPALQADSLPSEPPGKSCDVPQKNKALLSQVVEARDPDMIPN